MRLQSDLRLMVFRGEKFIMNSIINISGEKSGAKINILVGETKTSFDLRKDINAENLFKALCFSAEVNYLVERDDCGGIEKKSFDSFCKLIEDIASELNSLTSNTENSTSDSTDGSLTSNY